MAYSYYVREIARLTDTAAGTLHKELARLAGEGLLVRESVGNQVRYSANRAGRGWAGDLYCLPLLT